MTTYTIDWNVIAPTPPTYTRDHVNISGPMWPGFCEGAQHHGQPAYHLFDPYDNSSSGNEDTCDDCGWDTYEDGHDSDCAVAIADAHNDGYHGRCDPYDDCQEDVHDNCSTCADCLECLDSNGHYSECSTYLSEQCADGQHSRCADYPGDWTCPEENEEGA